MVKSPFVETIEKILAPLRFAVSGGEDRALERARLVKNFESHVKKGFKEAKSLRISLRTKEDLSSIERNFFERERWDDVVSTKLALEKLVGNDYLEMRLGENLSFLPGIGEKRSRVLSKRGLENLTQLLFFFPVRYDDRSELRSVGDLKVGDRTTFDAKVVLSGSSTRKGRLGHQIVEAVVGDETGTIQLKWFRSFDSLLKKLEKGNKLRVTGDVKRFKFNKEIIHPEIEVHPLKKSEGNSGIVAEYSQVEGIPQRTLRGAIDSALESRLDFLYTYAPQPCGWPRLPTVPEALKIIHFPGTDEDLEALCDRSHLAYQRLVLEELYLLEVGLALRKVRRASVSGHVIEKGSCRVERSIVALPFKLTRSQKRVWKEIEEDLSSGSPMNRLLQGDVGSGKTVVAYLAALAASSSGFQTAFMTPTELLSEQHARTLVELGSGEPKALKVGLLTASMSRKDLGIVKGELREGEIECVVGTQALIQSDVEFKNLGLAIIDEQHRFGVRQRSALQKKTIKARTPHTLVMTATPIPRTLAHTMYGDLDLSVIDELPPGRQKVNTMLLRKGEGGQVMRFLRETLGRGEQAYVVYPMIQESEAISLRAAKEQAEVIKTALKHHKVSLLHGQQDSADRIETMKSFASGETSVLVTTTVIEVGVDIPNASLIIIEHAERFGLAQLHQLRGRVGRGSVQGSCILIARGSSDESEARLRAMLETTNGFRIADADLAIRGPGELLGTHQHGHLPDFQIADLLRDSRLLEQARELALATVDTDSRLQGSPELASAVGRRWGPRLRLADVG